MFCKHFEGRKFGDVVKKCYECDKNLNPTELAMFYKLNGRFEAKLRFLQEVARKY